LNKRGQRLTDERRGALDTGHFLGFGEKFIFNGNRSAHGAIPMARDIASNDAEFNAA
jgi:hypothetical protein